ncbi:ABC transporter ATP-binding protein [Candidatus Contubernalis alkaliaceticus]|uniref:ABC transporter ATP-binding protein n=1 Tax=Candidatus Contubernalis alkaliaceticus TaxID=338645 RepID=UPI001F4C175B|nr:ABC transporter ATP-binding protein [Candidatus Contubernalis alkalaceticus]UNC92033.1 ABC transporter ATP-binding protein [Candidatus Contubernalis alkalaceticus]
MSILKATTVRKVYGGGLNHAETVALNNVDIYVDKGEFVSVMGPSGSGKSTLLNILSGFDYATSGEVVINETNITAMEPDRLAIFRRANIGYVFQEYNLLDSLTIKENIMLPMILDNRDIVQMQQKADDLLALLGISEIKEKRPFSVSGGQQQRAAIGRALINDTAILFADEPTGNLDSKASRVVLHNFLKMNKERSITILMVTHNPYAASFSDRVLFLQDGNIKTQLYKKDDQEDFFQQILDNLAALEERSYDF